MNFCTYIFIFKFLLTLRPYITIWFIIISIIIIFVSKLNARLYSFNAYRVVDYCKNGINSTLIKMDEKIMFSIYEKT
jgi:hypothetical protein